MLKKDDREDVKAQDMNLTVPGSSPAGTSFNTYSTLKVRSRHAQVFRTCMDT